MALASAVHVKYHVQSDVASDSIWVSREIVEKLCQVAMLLVHSEAFDCSVDMLVRLGKMVESMARP